MIRERKRVRRKGIYRRKCKRRKIRRKRRRKRRRKKTRRRRGVVESGGGGLGGGGGSKKNNKEEKKKKKREGEGSQKGKEKEAGKGWRRKVERGERKERGGAPRLVMDGGRANHPLPVCHNNPSLGHKDLHLRAITHRRKQLGHFMHLPKRPRKRRACVWLCMGHSAPALLNLALLCRLGAPGDCSA